MLSLSSILRLSPPNGFPTKTLCESLISSMRATCFIHTLLFVVIILISGEDYKILSLPSCSFLHSPHTTSLSDSNILLWHPVLKHLWWFSVITFIWSSFRSAFIEIYNIIHDLCRTLLKKLEFIMLLANDYVEQDLSSEADSRPDTQKIPIRSSNQNIFRRTGLYPGQYKVYALQSYFLTIHFNIILSSTSRPSEGSLPFRLPNQNSVRISDFPSTLPISLSLFLSPYQYFVESSIQVN
jgi:hypothetical protein